MPVLRMDIPPDSPKETETAIESCILQIAQGEKQALASLYERTRGAVYSFALSILKNTADAEDVLQDTYLQIWRSADRYSSYGKPLAWIFAITRNLALGRLREQKRVVTAGMEDWPETDTAEFAVKSTVDAEDRLMLSSLMQMLSDEERQIVVLHAVAGMRHREIAVLLKRSLPAVLSRYSRAMKKLRNAWKEIER